MPVFLFAAVGATPLPKQLIANIKTTPTGRKVINLLEPFFLILLLLAVTVYLVDGSFNPFLYFRF